MIVLYNYIPIRQWCFGGIDGLDCKKNSGVCYDNRMDFVKL